MGQVNVVDQARGSEWALYCGDSAEVLRGIPDRSIGLSVFSPPFESLYTYSATERDLGNSRSPLEFWRHFGFISRELLRVTMPGRIVACHVADIPSLKERDGVIGLKDFSGATVRHFRRAGFVYHGRVTIDKDPQAQAIRTKSKGLLFTQMHKDSSWSRPALADYILLCVIVVGISGSREYPRLDLVRLRVRYRVELHGARQRRVRAWRGARRRSHGRRGGTRAGRGHTAPAGQ
jgi:hypothetical protein